MFSNGANYLTAAGNRFNQATFHARRIMELTELYDVTILDYFIGLSIEKDLMDIKSFKGLLRDYNDNKI